MALPDRLGSLSSVKSDETANRREESSDSNLVLLQRTAIIQKDEKGYGLTVSGDNPVYVASVKPGGAAEKAGVQVNDRIIKVNGKLVTNSNHKEVVQLIRAGSYVALTLLGKPPSTSHQSNRESAIDESGSFNRNSITAPLPVDAEKEKDFRKQKANTIRVMYEAAHEEYDKLKKAYRSNPSDRLQAQIVDQEKTLKILEAQLQEGPKFTRESHSVNVDDTGTSDSSSWTTSVPITVSDLASSDSPHTSPSTSPTPIQNTETDIPGDSAQEESQQGQGMSKSIIGMDDDEFLTEDDCTGDSKAFSDLSNLETKPAHMAIFLHYVLNHHNPSALLFHMLSGIYGAAQGNPKDLKKWAYEIHSTFLTLQAPLKVQQVDELMVQEIDSYLQFKSEKEELLRNIFVKSRQAASKEVQKLLDDLRQKKEQGLIQGSNELREQMDKNEELKIVERYLVPDLDKFVELGQNDDKFNAQSWAIATFLRHVGLHKSSSSSLERVQSFVMKDKRASKLLGRKSKTIRGHQLAPSHLSKREFCLHCNKVLWGVVGFQGYQCQTCEQYVHKACADDLDEVCSRNKKKKGASSLPNFIKTKPQPGGAVKSALSDIISAATPIIGGEGDRDPVVSPTHQNKPNVFTQPLQDSKDADLNAFREGGHSVNNMVSRFENKSPDRDTRKSDIGRSESMKGRGDQRDRPTRRSKSDVEQDGGSDIIKALTTSGSSSASSLRSVDSPSSSMDTLTDQIKVDSDFDVEAELPSLKQVLGEETVRKLKPKEKKRQDVINELFYTEKCHVRNLKILEKLFYRPMLKEPAIPDEFTKTLFPNLENMITLHRSLNNSMQQRRKEKTVISDVGDILVARFDGTEGESFRTGCAIFCRNQSHALESLKSRTRKDAKTAQLLSDAENNPLCQRLALKDIIPKQFMRLTKYPLLIENLLKYTSTNTEEYSNLEKALKCSKQILEYVNQAVKDCENKQRLIDLQRRIDKKAIDGSQEEELRTFDLSKHKLIHDGTLTWRINRKQIELHVVLLERAMVLLQKQEDRLVLKLQSTQLVPGKEDTKRQSPLLWLNNVLARDDATDKKAFFVVNTSKAGPQIYQLVAGTADEQKRWTKYITQAAESLKKNEINLKNKKQQMQQLAQEEIPVPPPVEEEIQEGNHEPTNLEGQADEVISNDQVISPLEKLHQNDEDLASVLETRIKILAEFLKVSPDEVAEKAQELVTMESSDPADLVLACQHHITQLMELIKDSSIGALKQHDIDEQQLETLEDLSLPIPMERLQDMANRMNQILMNLLAQTRATASSPVSAQAAVNSQDEEQNRLRRELKFARDELNRLRRIQKIQMERNLAKAKEAQEGEEVQQPVNDRPESMVSDSLTLSESEVENRDEITSETDTNEDGMPGIPIEPEAVNELASEILNEVSPVTMETLPDMESPVPTEESGNLENQFDAVEELLREVEPPDEDQLEEMEIPGLKIVKVSDDSDSESDHSDNEDGDEEEEEESVSDTGDTVTNVVDDDDADKDETQTDLDEQTAGSTAVNDADASSRLQGDIDNNGAESDENSGKRDSGEIFHDAVDGSQTENNNTNIGEDPGGQSVKGEPDPAKTCDVNTATVQKHSDNNDTDNKTQSDENVTNNSSDNVAPVIENNNVESQSDGNVDCNTGTSLIPTNEGDKNGNNTETSLTNNNSGTDESVTSLTDKDAEQV